MGWFSRKKAPSTPPGPPTQPNARGTWAQGGGQFVPDELGLVAGEWNANDLPGAWPLGIPNVDSRGLLDQTGQPQPLPLTFASQLLNSSKTRYQTFVGHTFVQARLPDPGAPQWTFDSLGLVEFSPVGTGIVNQGSLNPLEGAPFFPNFGVVTQGLGGIVQGEIVTQPLMLDPTGTAGLQIDQ